MQLKNNHSDSKKFKKRSTNNLKQIVAAQESLKKAQTRSKSSAFKNGIGNLL